MSDRPAMRSAVCPQTTVWPTVKRRTTQVLLLLRLADEPFFSTPPAKRTPNLANMANVITQTLTTWPM